ncbi:MAG TPA: hypothetical protein IAC37_02455 [Candidatus Ventrimonas merdavium]|nr:hypothetical protein [Candidatus Ventrimonas merdavium]
MDFYFQVLCGFPDFGNPFLIYITKPFIYTWSAANGILSIDYKIHGIPCPQRTPCAKIKISNSTTNQGESSRGTMNDVSSSLKAFLDYVAGIMTEDSFVQELDEAVAEARKNREWRHEYMTLYLRDMENLEKGRAEGRAEGKAEGLAEGLERMIAALKKYGVPEEEIRKTVQENYGLTEEELNQYLG